MMQLTEQQPRTPWPLLLTLLNLPQLSIMISLQVSANRAQGSLSRRYAHQQNR
jgi:hypothetical protein